MIADFLNQPEAIATGLLLAASFLIISFYRLSLGLAIFVFVSFSEVLPSFSGITLIKFAAGAVIVLWLFYLFSSKKEKADPATISFSVFASILVFSSYIVLSSVWAEESGEALLSATRLIPSMLIVLVILSVVQKKEELRLVISAYVLGAVLAVALGTLFLGFSGQAFEEGRLAGLGGDPNLTAAQLLSALCFSIGLFLTGDRYRGLWLFTSAVSLVGIFASGSRGIILASLVVAFLALFLTEKKHRLKTIAGVLAAIVVGVVLSLSFNFSSSGDRLIEAFSGDSVSESTTGRSDLYKTGVSIASDYPVFGVGAGNFPIKSGEYVFKEVGIERSDLLIEDPKVSHNTYLDVLSELGLVGLLLFSFIIFASLAATIRAIQKSDDSMPRLALLGQVAFIVAAFFVSAQYSQQFWIVLALGPALLKVESISVLRKSE